MSDDQLKDVSQLLRLSQRYGSIAKYLVGAIVALAAWQATVQLRLAGHDKELATIHAERSKMMEDYRSWREAVVASSARQDTILKQLSGIAASQQEQINHLAGRR